MHIICIRPLMRDPNNTDKWFVLKGLKEEEFYYLYDGDDIKDYYIYPMDKSVPDDFYYTGRWNQTSRQMLCAIVG